MVKSEEGDWFVLMLFVVMFCDIGVNGGWNMDILLLEVMELVYMSYLGLSVVEGLDSFCKNKNSCNSRNR